MSQVIAGIYEIDQKIGAGGGGVVYLGRHLRLQKLVVLKADRRNLNTRPEALRREVDMLKNLSHTYIPQVYDFVQENGVVYTVMDYIEGESLDKILARGEKIAQPLIVKYACQLLEALDYLHKRPPHGILHGDIKPANIMLRPNGDICLIDFNIALALGEDGAVKVGFSRGYASPEHYSADFIRYEDSEKTVRDDSEKTVTDTKNVSFSAGSVTRGQAGKLLDVRSDIYSLGATLYHLISSRRPAQNAEQVLPLNKKDCSIEVAEIINKAMEPKPENRYQTAEEMLQAFLHLKQNDLEMIRYKKQVRAVGIFLFLLLMTGVGGMLLGLKQRGDYQEALKLSQYSGEKLKKGDVSGAIRNALDAIPDKKSVFTVPVTAEAQKALSDALGVYDLSDGFGSYDSLELPAAPFDMTLSPDGKKLAVVYGYEVTVYDLDDGSEIVSLPIQKSALSDCVFVDDRTVVYASDHGTTAYDIAEKRELWCGEASTILAVSEDKKVVAAVNCEQNAATIYDIRTGEVSGQCSFENRHLTTAENDIFADPKDYIFRLSADGKWLAVSFSDGGLTVFDWKNPENTFDIYEQSDYIQFEGGFCGTTFAYAAKNNQKSIFGMTDVEQNEDVMEAQSDMSYIVQADSRGIFLANENLLVKLDTSREQTELAYVQDENITGFSVGERFIAVAEENQKVAVFDSGATLVMSDTCEKNSDFVLMGHEHVTAANRDEPVVRIWKAEEHSDAAIFTYDASYEHEEARVSTDGNTAMLFGINGFRIYDRDGKLCNETELENPESIYDEQFKKEPESYLEVTWYDGTVRTYSAADGTLLSEEKGEKPDRTLDETFLTENYEIRSSLHDAPQVYDRVSGKWLASLEKEDYLTYVTQVQEDILTEYISTTGGRYGILLNDRLEEIAYLPNVCDVVEDTFIFDTGSGELRQCRLYSLQELVALGESYIE